MKKFLVFLTALVICVSFGLTTYYFLRNDEIITVNTSEIYCNAGDVISLDELNIKVKKKNKSTTYNYDAGGDEVTSLVKYDSDLASYIVDSTAGGDVDIVIGTSNKKYSRLKVTLHIGNGSTDNPYYIFSADDLSKIGTKYASNKAYVLQNDIDLGEDFTSIAEFNGVFDGNNHTIRGLKIVDQNLTNAGLFASLRSNSKVKNLTIDNATLSGEFANVGILAGSIYGSVENVAIKNCSIKNAYNGGNTGSIAGRISNNDIITTCAENVTIEVTSFDANNVTAGFVGSVSKSSIKACYIKNVNINVESSTLFTAGFVGKFEIGTATGTIQQSYAQFTSNQRIFGFVGNVDSSSVVKVNGYMLRHFVGNVVINENANSSQTSSIIGGYDTTYFKNLADQTKSPFYDETNAIYGIKTYTTVEDIDDNKFILYAVDNDNITYWDTETIWDLAPTLPVFVKSPLTPTTTSGEYLRKLSSSTKEVDSDEDLKEVIEDQKKEEEQKQEEQKTDDEKTEEKEDIVIKFVSPDITIDPSTWSTRAIKNTTIDGAISDTQNATLTIYVNKVENGCLGLFSTIDNCTIKNLNIIVKGFKGDATYAGALAGKIYSSTADSNCQLSNIIIMFEDCDFSACSATYFGGLAGSISNCNIDNVQIRELDASAGAFVQLAGLTTEAKSSKISNISVNAQNLTGSTVAGLIVTNNATVTNAGVRAFIYSNGGNSTILGSAFCVNYGTVSNIKVSQNVSVLKDGDTLVAGVACFNYGTITDSVVSETGVNVKNNYSNVYIGGVAVQNVGKIESTIVKVSSLGASYANSNINVGGLTCSNDGQISRCVMSADLSGSYVAGLTIEMKGKSSATIDQVYIGKINSISRELSSVELKANKYLAGLVVDFRYGKISNIQSKANLTGLSNQSRSSLVTLVFDSGATLVNSTIDSIISGYGRYYREVWTDFADCDDNVNFTFASNNKSLFATDSRFNLYTANTNHGKMQSVVINSANPGVSLATASLGTATAFIKDYDSKDKNSSFVKTTDKFYDTNEFQGSFEFVSCKSSILKISHKETKTLTFNIGNIWNTNNGISLRFLEDINLF